MILNSCTAGKVAIKTGIEEIRFGYGGGFTGKVTTYLLMPDGHLSIEGKERKILKRIDLKSTLAIFTNEQEVETVSLNEPDNVYSFVEIKTRVKTNHIVWGFGSTQVPDKVVQLYNKLIFLTK